jgi:hypothetical protein
MVNPLPVASVTENSNQITADQNSATYQWLDCNNGFIILSGATTQMYSPLVNGSYAVEIDLNGCVDTSDCTTILSIGIEGHTSNAFKIFPNPTNGHLYIEIPGSAFNYEVSDLLGNILLSGKATRDNLSIDLTGFSTGIYILRSGPETYRITKQ